MKHSKPYTTRFIAPFRNSLKIQNPSNRIVEGIIWSSEETLLGDKYPMEIVDLSYFKRKGRITWEHNSDPEDIIGIPLEVISDKDYIYLTASLYSGLQKADMAWELIKFLQENDPEHQLGFSIEGKLFLERSVEGMLKPKKILVFNVGVTAHPLQPQALITKIHNSLATGYGISPEQMEGIAPLRKESIAKRISKLDRDLGINYGAIAKLPKPFLDWIDTLLTKDNWDDEDWAIIAAIYLLKNHKGYNKLLDKIRNLDK